MPDIFGDIDPKDKQSNCIDFTHKMLRLKVGAHDFEHNRAGIVEISSRRYLGFNQNTGFIQCYSMLAVQTVVVTGRHSPIMRRQCRRVT